MAASEMGQGDAEQERSMRTEIMVEAEEERHDHGCWGGEEDGLARTRGGEREYLPQCKDRGLRVRGLGRGGWANEKEGLTEKKRFFCYGRTRKHCVCGTGCSFSTILHESTSSGWNRLLDLSTKEVLRLHKAMTKNQYTLIQICRRDALVLVLLQCLAMSKLSVAMTVNRADERLFVPRAGTVYDGLDGRTDQIIQEAEASTSNLNPIPANLPSDGSPPRPFTFAGPFMLTLGNNGMLRGTFTNLPSTMRSSTETDDHESSLSDEGLDACNYHRMNGRNVLDGAGSLDYPISRQPSSRNNLVRSRSETDTTNSFSRSTWNLPENFDIVYQNNSNFNLSSISAITGMNQLDSIPIDPANFQAEVNLLMVSNGSVRALKRSGD
eukprot:263167-Hanusia_phi.AAC.4